jgi:hypothetical protein
MKAQEGRTVRTKTIAFNPLLFKVQQDPYRHYARLRDESPIYYIVGAHADADAPRAENRMVVVLLGAWAAAVHSVAVINSVQRKRKQRWGSSKLFDGKKTLYRRTLWQVLLTT